MNDDRKLTDMRTWSQSDEVWMLTAWSEPDDAEVACYVLQRFRGGEWTVARSWSPASDLSATVLARAVLKPRREVRE